LLKQLEIVEKVVEWKLFFKLVNVLADSL